MSILSAKSQGIGGNVYSLVDMMCSDERPSVPIFLAIFRSAKQMTTISRHVHTRYVLLLLSIPPISTQYKRYSLLKRRAAPRLSQPRLTVSDRRARNKTYDAESDKFSLCVNTIKTTYRNTRQSKNPIPPPS